MILFDSTVIKNIQNNVCIISETVKCLKLESRKSATK